MPSASEFQYYSGNPLDRAQVERRDPALMAAFLADAKTRVALFQGERPLIALSDAATAGKIGWLALSDIRVQHIDHSAFYLLGKTAEGHARFVCDIHREDEDFEVEATTFNDIGKFIDLRSVGLQGLVSNPELSILAQGKSITSWHRSHQFCSTCGAQSESVEGGIRRHCPRCHANHFPRTDPVVIMLIYHGDECLLGRSANYKQGQYSTLAGFVEQGETIEEAVRREIKEETRIDVGAVSYHTSQPWPFPSTLMIGCHGEALNHEIHIDDHEIEHARWFARDEVRLMFNNTHPDGLTVPHKYAIAHHLIRHFADGA